MSAYLVEPHHIGYLTRYAIDHDLVVASAAEVATVLARANIASLTARYADRVEIDPEYIANCVAAAKCIWMNFDAAQVASSANCYDYQACEVDNYDFTAAALITRQIRDKAVSELTANAVWGAPKPDGDGTRGGGPVSLSEMQTVYNQQ